MGREERGKDRDFALACLLSRSVVSDSLWPCALRTRRLLCPWNFFRQEYYWSWVAISSSRGSSWPSYWTRVSRFSCISIRRRILYPLSHQGSLWLWEETVLFAEEELEVSERTYSWKIGKLSADGWHRRRPPVMNLLPSGCWTLGQLISHS